MALDVSTIKQNHRAMWAAGDYPSVSRRIASVAEELVAAAGVDAAPRARARPRAPARDVHGRLPRGVDGTMHVEAEYLMTVARLPA